MKVFKVNLTIDNGYSCSGVLNDDENEITIEVNDQIGALLNSALEANNGGLTNTDIEKLIEEGNDILKELHSDLVKKCCETDVEFWLDRAKDNDFGEVHERMLKDIENGLFVPDMSFEDYCAENEIDPSDEDYDEEDVQYDYETELEDNEYYLWLDTLSIEEHAERVGLDLDVVYAECNYSYVITKVD